MKITATNIEIEIQVAEGGPRSYRCHNCGAVMGEDVGAWIVTIDGNGLAILCSRQCEEQLVPKEPPELLRRLLDEYLKRLHGEGP